MEEKLTPQVAIEIIYKATGNLTLTRADHQLLEKSLRVLAELLPKEQLLTPEKTEELAK